MVASELVPQFEQNITIQENALRLLAGELPGAIQRTSILNQLPLAENLSTGVPSALVSRRPDVKSYELALVAANGTVGFDKAAMYPALRITAQGGVDSYLASNWFNIPSSLFGIVAASIAQPLLDHKQLKTTYDVAKVNRDKTVLQFRAAVLNAVGEVSNALVQIEKLKEQRTIVATRVNTLQQATTNANLLYKNGLANYLEVITAQSNVLQSELELTSIKRQELDAATDLYIALGGGWK